LENDLKNIKGFRKDIKIALMVDEKTEIFAKQERQTKRQFVSGESHYLFGKNTFLMSIIQIKNPIFKYITRQNSFFM